MRFVYLDFDIDNTREKYSRACNFVFSTSLRYGFSSNDLRKLQGSELHRIREFHETDHEFQSNGELVLKPPFQGRIVLKLYNDKCPMACENFLRLARGQEKDKKFHYKNTKIHRVVRGFCFQGGDIIFGNGTGGECVFGTKKFKDEKNGLNLKHCRRGLLSMGNSGKNSNTSQFFITFGATPQCDGKHVIFGEVVSGFDVLDTIESYSNPSGERPLSPINITDCGDWDPIHMPGAGSWLDYPDPESYSGITPIFMSWVRVGVLVPNPSSLKKFKEMLNCCVVTDIIATGCITENDIISKATAMLSNNEVDVILVAPACSSPMIRERICTPGIGFLSKPVKSLHDVTIWLRRKKIAEWKDYSLEYFI